jgi:hypothetical protein
MILVIESSGEAQGKCLVTRKAKLNGNLTDKVTMKSFPQT